MFRTAQIAVLVSLLLAGSAAFGQEMEHRRPLRDFHVDPASIQLPSTEPGSPPAPDAENLRKFQGAVTDQMYKVQACVEARHFTEEGHVQAAFSVLSTGEFASVSVVDDFPNPEPELVRCVWETLAHLRLDSPPDRERPFHITFVFGAPMQVNF